jgi:hypothetical protein
MKQYSVEYTRQNFKTLLENLPFEITRYGTVIAKVVGKSTTNVVQETSRVKTPLIEYFQAKKNVSLCVHGFAKGLCKKGCK